MLRGQCAQCGAEGPLRAFTAVGQKLCCYTCSCKLEKEARARGEDPQIHSVIDPTICYKCKRDNGSEELPAIGGVRYCARCSEELYQRPFPQWLQLSLAALLVLLAFALLHGKPYFRAGRDLLHGQKLIDRGRYAEAIPYLQASLKVAPACEEGVLLLAKAYVLTGRPDQGDKMLRDHNGGRFEKNDLSDEVVGQIYGRVTRAFQSAEQAAKLHEEKKWEEAAKAMHEAAGLYPEFGGFTDAVVSYDESAAFERKDYDGFLKISEEAWNQHLSSPEYAGLVASALACKYAVTGQPEYRGRSEQMLDTARHLAH